VLWRLIVACLLVLGFFAFFFGLALVMPVLGHSTWHLYRKVVEPDLSPRPQYHPRPEVRRYAADFPAVLFSPRHPKNGHRDMNTWATCQPTTDDRGTPFFFGVFFAIFEGC
jgi:hypothetical protein